MKHLLLTTIAAVLLVGCGESQPPETLTAKAPDIDIHGAAAKGNIEAVKQHIAAGTDVSAKKNGFGVTPLHNAASRGHKEIAELLISEGADVNAVGMHGHGGTPLHYAATKEVAELLIAKGADVNTKDNVGDTPIDLADGEIAALLRKHGGKTGEELSIHQAAKKGNIEAVKQHLAAGTDMNAIDLNGMTPIDLADGEIAALLLKHGGKTGEELSIHKAAMSGNIEAVKQHLNDGAEVNAKNSDGRTPLHLAAEGGHGEIVELLILKGANVNAKNDGGETPLDWATMSYPETAPLLRKHGGKTSEELNSIRINWEAKKRSVADLLRKHGGKTSEELKAEESIHAAAIYGNIEAVKQHLAADADVNAKYNRGRTPLHLAAFGGHKEIVELLIAKGGDVNARDFLGMTPLNMAAGHKETAELLRKHGGKTGEELKAEGK